MLAYVPGYVAFNPNTIMYQGMPYLTPTPLHASFLLIPHYKPRANTNIRFKNAKTVSMIQIQIQIKWKNQEFKHKHKSQ